MKETSEDISVSLNWVNASMDIKGRRQGHAMHGVFHSNGFGHLLCVNGLEMGSKLCGSQIMDFWDRLCKGLRARYLFRRLIYWMNNIIHTAQDFKKIKNIDILNKHNKKHIV